MTYILLFLKILVGFFVLIGVIGSFLWYRKDRRENTYTGLKVQFLSFFLAIVSFGIYLLVENPQHYINALVTVTGFLVIWIIALILTYLNLRLLLGKDGVTYIPHLPDISSGIFAQLGAEIPGLLRFRGTGDK